MDDSYLDKLQTHGALQLLDARAEKDDRVVTFLRGLQGDITLTTLANQWYDWAEKIPGWDEVITTWTEDERLVLERLLNKAKRDPIISNGCGGKPKGGPPLDELRIMSVDQFPKYSSTLIQTDDNLSQKEFMTLHRLLTSPPIAVG